MEHGRFILTDLGHLNGQSVVTGVSELRTGGRYVVAEKRGKCGGKRRVGIGGWRERRAGKREGALRETAEKTKTKIVRISVAGNGGEKRANEFEEKFVEGIVLRFRHFDETPKDMRCR